MPVQRAKMEPQPHPLSKLLELRGVEFLPEFRLPGEDDAQHLFLVGLDTRQHANLFEHLERQVLRLVDDQYDLLAVGILFDQEHVEHVQQFDLALVEGLEAEFRQRRLQEFRGGELRLRDDRVHHAFVEFLEKRLQQRGLAGADFTRDHDKAVGQPDRRLHVRLGPGMLLAPVDKCRVRR